MKTVAFIPIKLNNQRLPGKNTMSIGGVPLVTRVCDKALRVSELDEVYVFCSSPEIQEYLPSGVKLLPRSKSLDSDTTLITEVNSAFIDAVPSDIYVSLMATAPFVAISTILACTRAVQSGEYDSAFPVKRLNSFLWIDGTPNYDLQNIPRTQDLSPVYMETAGFYVFTRDSAQMKVRIGKMPYMHEVGELEALDIDNKEDFDICDAVAKHILKEQ